MGGGGTKCHLVRFNLRPTVFSFQASQVSRDSDSDFTFILRLSVT